MHAPAGDGREDLRNGFAVMTLARQDAMWGIWLIYTYQARAQHSLALEHKDDSQFPQCTILEDSQTRKYQDGPGPFKLPGNSSKSV